MNLEISLRAPVEADLPVFYAHQTDPEGNRMVGAVPRDRGAFMAHWSKTSADPAVLRMTVLVDGRAAGFVGSFDRQGLREVCYWLGKEHWGKGVATRALEAFLARDQRRPLWGRVAKRNPASVRVLEKCGFTIVGEDKYSNPAGEEIEEFLLKLGARQ